MQYIVKCSQPSEPYDKVRIIFYFLFKQTIASHISHHLKYQLGGILDR